MNQEIDKARRRQDVKSEGIKKVDLFSVVSHRSDANMKEKSKNSTN